MVSDAHRRRRPTRRPALSVTRLLIRRMEEEDLTVSANDRVVRSMMETPMNNTKKTMRLKARTLSIDLKHEVCGCISS